MTVNISKATSTQYSFVIGKIPSEDTLHAVDELRLNIFNVSLPSINLENTQFNWQGKHVQFQIGGISFDPLNINFTVDVEFTNWKVLAGWILYIADNKDIPSKPANDYVTDANLVLYDNFGKIHTTITYKNMWIQTLGELTFTVREGETQIEGSAIFQYDRYEIT